MDIRAPVFVKVDEYKDVADIVTLMKEKITQAKFLLDKIAEIKAREDSELAEWSKELDDVEMRVQNIDRVVFEP